MFGIGRLMNRMIVHVTGPFVVLPTDVCTSIVPLSAERLLSNEKNVSCEIEDFVEARLSSCCVGYFDRAYYGFYVTSSRMLVLIEGYKM